VIKNEENLIFIYGFDIEIDGSLSYDEDSLRSVSINEQKLNFNWECDNEFNSLCKESNSNILKINTSDYKNLVSLPIDYKTYKIKLTITKDRRLANTEFYFNIKKPLEIKLSKNEPFDLSQLIVINPLSRGSSQEILFGISYLDKNINIFDYNYFWTVSHFKQDNQYLNGRREFNLKVLNDDLFTGYNEIIVEVKDKSGERFLKNYNYQKARAPYGGNCLVSPMTGISLSTNFVFNISGWETNAKPLIYKIKYLNEDNNYTDLTNGGFLESSWKSNIIPVCENLIVEVTDSIGLHNTAICKFQVKPNNKLEDIDYYLDKEFDPNNRLLLIAIYKTNKQNLKNYNKHDYSLNNRALDIVDTYMKNSIENIQQDLENIIVTILNISNQNFDKEKIKILNNSLNIIIQNIEPLLQYVDKIQNVYRILDNILKKAIDLEEFKNNKDELDTLQEYLNTLNSKLFSNIINGQALLISNLNYDIQMNKISQLNVPNLSIDYDHFNKKFRNLNNNKNIYNSDIVTVKKTKIRYLQNSNTDDCTNSISALCIPSNNITSIMNNEGGKGVGFQGQLNHKENLPIKEKQFSNSLDFGLSVEGKNGNLRKLDLSKVNIRYEVRLKLPNKDNSTSSMEDATCVQYINKEPNISCESWYDDIANEVICSCLKQGLTVNVMEKALSNFSKLSQFHLLDSDLCI